LIGPSQTLQPTAAAMLVLRRFLSFSAAAAAELGIRPRSPPGIQQMISKAALLKMHSDWASRLEALPRYKFADLGQLHEQLAPAGLYMIWIQLKEEASPRCLKIGKAQRAGKTSLHARLKDHLGSRGKGIKYGPNILAQHLMQDYELASLTGLNLQDRAERQRLLHEFCSFQAWPFPVTVSAREVAILESFLEVVMLPRYVGKCGGYGCLKPQQGERTAGWHLIPSE
jgi:hypothetical protein